MFFSFIAKTQNITNVTATQEQNNIIVSYQLEIKEPFKINLYVSEGNNEWKGPLKQVKGNIGDNVNIGSNRIIWDVLAEYNELKGNNISFKVVAGDLLKVGDKYQGGIIFYIKNGHGLIVATNDIEENNGSKEMSWDDAKSHCEEIDIMGFDDWHLPLKKELNLLYENKDKLGNFKDFFYWSSSDGNYNYAWGQNFGDGLQDEANKDYLGFVRPVRAF